METIKRIEEARKYLPPQTKEQTKKCTICNTKKPLTDFYKDNGSPDGKGYYCKTCTRLNAKKRAEKRKETRTENSDKNDKPTTPEQPMPTRNRNPTYTLRKLIITDMQLANQAEQPITLRLHLLTEIERKQTEAK